jgi:cytochrome c peroxidase
VWNLNEAVAIMGTAQLGQELNDEEVKQIVTFLQSLTGKMPEVVYPSLPPETDRTPHPTAEMTVP